VEALTASTAGAARLAGAAGEQMRRTLRQRLMLALHGTIPEAQSEPVTLQEQRRDDLLNEAVRRQELWTGQWAGGINIIGDTNIGEVRSDWARQETKQRRWWWRSSAGERPTPATVYRASLQPPNPSDAPPLP
jgi:hypothetical protein